MCPPNICWMNQWMKIVYLCTFFRKCHLNHLLKTKEFLISLMFSPRKSTLWSIVLKILPYIIILRLYASMSILLISININKMSVTIIVLLFHWWWHANSLCLQILKNIYYIISLACDIENNLIKYVFLGTFPSRKRML